MEAHQQQQEVKKFTLKSIPDQRKKYIKRKISPEYEREKKKEKKKRKREKANK